MSAPVWIEMSGASGQGVSGCLWDGLMGLWDSCCTCLGRPSPYLTRLDSGSDLTQPVVRARSPEPPAPPRRPSPDHQSAQDDRLLPKGVASSSAQLEAAPPGHKRKGSASDSKAAGLNLLAGKLPSTLSLASDEEEQCPTCLEGYSEENPKIWTSCSHHYHLQCLLAWQNRSPTCPLCGTNITFDEL